MALTDKLTAIGNAIRAKDGSTALLTLDEMPIAIAAIETPSTPGGDNGIPEEAFLLTGDVSNRFINNGWNWFIHNFGNKITTKDISRLYSTFMNCKTLESIPFEINLKANTQNIDLTSAFSNCNLVPKITLNVPETSSLDKMESLFSYCWNLKDINNFSANHSTYKNMGYIFNECHSLERLPYIYNAYPESLSTFFGNCRKLKSIPDDYFDTWNFNRINTYAYSSVATMFSNCKSLRAIPKQVFDKFGRETTAKSNYYCFYYNGFPNCYVLDEIVGLPVITTVNTSNMFNTSFNFCYRLKEMTFETNEDGTAKTVQWKGQTIDLSSYIGHWKPTDANKKNFEEYGISWDKAIGSKDEYAALKDDADATPYTIAYARYNHNSAVNTINSLPDTSAYIAANGGTNTIKFGGNAGSATDGGAINTLTEEEIAVATAKGWTVTFS